MTKTYYHATPSENLVSIIKDGCIKKGWLGVVYLTETAQDAVKFCAIRGQKFITVFEVEVDESLIEESFDHSNEFFKCRAFTYAGDIPDSQIKEILSFIWGE